MRLGSHTGLDTLPYLNTWSKKARNSLTNGAIVRLLGTWVVSWSLSQSTCTRSAVLVDWDARDVKGLGVGVLLPKAADVSLRTRLRGTRG